MIIAAMTAALPPGVPLSFTKIFRARFEGPGDKRRAVADVEMFDGRPARLAVWQWGSDAFTSWAHEWLSLDGGHASWENGRWTRVDPETLELIPGNVASQYSLFSNA
jgi:hypothetical protein